MLRILLPLGVGLWIALGVSLGQSEDQAQSLPKFETVRKLVRMYFQKQTGYEQGDLITREQAEEIFGYLRKIRWDVQEQEEILAALHAEKDFLPRTLRTKSGQPFMREVAKLPGGYDRLDRLSQLPRGQRMVSDLARAKDGYKLIEYMADTKGGDNLGKMLSQIPSGADFNQPTNRIYTEEGFVQRLKESYENQAKP